MNEYQIHDHIHLYTSWAAGRASSVKNNRFKVEIAQKMLSKSVIKSIFINIKF